MVTDHWVVLEANQVGVLPHDSTAGPAKAFTRLEPHVDLTGRAFDRALGTVVEQLGSETCEYPEHFELHRAVVKIIESRREMATGCDRWIGSLPSCWRCQSLRGFSVRLSGQDSRMGPFSIAVAASHISTPPRCTGLSSICFAAEPRFRVINSLLSEEAGCGPSSTVTASAQRPG